MDEEKAEVLAIMKGICAPVEVKSTLAAGVKPKHICVESTGCCCEINALEPDGDCPVHGHPFPPRCDCGRFVKRRSWMPTEEVEEARTVTRKLLEGVEFDLVPASTDKSRRREKSEGRG